MSLYAKIFNKIMNLYEISEQSTKYWVHIESYRCNQYKEFSLRITVYVFIEGRQESLFNKEIQLNDENAEQELQYIIKKMKELIPATNND